MANGHTFQNDLQLIYEALGGDSSIVPPVDVVDTLNWWFSQINEMISGELLPNAPTDLFDLLDFIARKEQKAKVYFSKAGSSFTGFVAYIDNGKTITGMKIASFYDDKKKANATLAKDLQIFLGDKMQNHDSIEWEAFEDNPANEIYQKAIPKWFPKYTFVFISNKKHTGFIYKLSK